MVRVLESQSWCVRVGRERMPKLPIFKELNIFIEREARGWEKDGNVKKNKRLIVSIPLGLL